MGSQPTIDASRDSGVYFLLAIRSNGIVASISRKGCHMPARPAASPSFSDRMAQLLQRVEYRRADSPDDREAIFRLRYDAYLREGEIGPLPSRRFADHVDEEPNAFNFGVYIDGVLAGAIRVSVTMPGRAWLPAFDVFEDILSPEIQAGKSFVDPSKFVADYASSRRHAELPYVILRLAWVAMEYFKADMLLGAIRAEHLPFYKRLWRCHLLCPPRPYPGLCTPVCLAAVDYPTQHNEVYRRHPFFQSNSLEQKVLFDRSPSV